MPGTTAEGACYSHLNFNEFFMQLVSTNLTPDVHESMQLMQAEYCLWNTLYFSSVQFAEVIVVQLVPGLCPT